MKCRAIIILLCLLIVSCNGSKSTDITDEIPIEVRECAMKNLGYNICRFMNDPDLARARGMTNREAIYKARLGDPHKSFYVSLTELTEYDYSIDFMSYVKFMGYEFPFIVEDEFIGTIAVSEARLHSESGCSMGFFSCPYLLNKFISYSPKLRDYYEIYGYDYISIGNSQGLVVVEINEEILVAPMNEAQAESLFPDIVLDKEFPFIPLEEALPLLIKGSKERIERIEEIRKKCPAVKSLKN